MKGDQQLPFKVKVKGHRVKFPHLFQRHLKLCINAAFSLGKDGGGGQRPMCHKIFVY